jgi:hypothetical protein
MRMSILGGGPSLLLLRSRPDIETCEERSVWLRGQ